MSSREEHKLLTLGKHNRSFRLICTVRTEFSSVVPSLDAPGVDAPGVDAPGVDVPGVDAPGVSELASKTICSLVTSSATLLVNSVSSYSVSCTVCNFRWDRTKR